MKHQPVTHRYVNHQTVSRQTVNRQTVSYRPGNHPFEDLRHENHPGRPVAHRIHRGDRRPNDRRPSGVNPNENHWIDRPLRRIDRPLRRIGANRTSAETVARRNCARRCRETIQWRDEESGQRAWRTRLRGRRREKTRPPQRSGLFID